MAIIDRDVYLLQRRRIAPIDIVYGSGVQIRLNMMDCAIPENATVEFFAQRGSDPVYRCPGTAAENSAYFTPPEGFFQPGDNALQLEINGKLIPLALAVRCDERISGIGSQETPEQVRPYVTQCREILEETKNVAVRTPYIGENGNWYVYDADGKVYVDSGIGAAGPKGDPFTYDDFTPEQLEGLKGDPFTYDDFTLEQLEDLKGPKGDPFTYDDFTPEQLEGLKGDPFTYDDFTPEQLEGLKGDPFTYDDFTPEQLEGLKGDPFTYDDFTPEQLENLKGPPGDPGASVSALDIFPVGYVYISVDSTSPASLFGGTWEQLKDVFLLAAGDTYAAGATGGEAEHTLTIDEMPNHNHSFTSGGVTLSVGPNYNRPTNATSYSSSHTYQSSPRGGDMPHNNMPPYLAVYMWKRVA